MNLLTDSWLQYRLIDGKEHSMPLAEALADPRVLDFALPRADFHGAAYQFAIGVLQTVFAPDDRFQWQELYQTPPQREPLQQAFAQISHAFELEGEGPCFMQDFDALADVKPTPVSGLLIDGPSENAIKQNTDHFVKRGLCNVLSPEMAALALFTLQVNAHEGGKGHRTSLRGGGPLTTLVLPQEDNAPLWQKLWLNVLDREAFSYKDPDFHSPELFPWLGPTKISKGKGTEIYYHEVHPLAQYWAMPRRIRLAFENGRDVCGVALKQVNRFCRHYQTKPNGNNYSGPWYHPLSPYRFNPKKPQEDRVSFKGKPDSIQYKQWYILLYADRDEGNIPAKVVSRYLDELSYDWGEVPRLWVFGYDMKSAKVCGWYSNEFPLLRLDLERRDLQLRTLKEMQELANEVLKQCRSAIKIAWLGEPKRDNEKDNAKKSKKVKFDASQVDLEFWQRTQRAFFNMVSSLLTAEDELSPTAAKAWLQALRQAAQDIFDELGLESLVPDRNMARKIRVRYKLTDWFVDSKPIKKFREAYGLDSLGKEENA